MTRDDAVRRLEDVSRTWDVLVVGGGASGLGAALDAASRGYDTLLLEQHDFAKGTSSRSTKLIHGGVRYLARGRIGLVRESLRERSLLRRNAPEIVRPLRFLVPSYSRLERAKIAFGLSLYDRLSGDPEWERSTSVGREEARARWPGLPVEGLRGATVFLDGQFDDTRLIRAVFRSIGTLGSVAINYVRVESFLQDRSGRIRGVVARDLESDRSHEVQARVVVEATGPWGDQVRSSLARTRASRSGADAPRRGQRLTLSRGAHVVLKTEHASGGHALLVPRTADDRVLFAIPWMGHLLVGTTDVPASSPELEPVASTEEIDFLLDQIGRYMSVAPRRSEVRSAWAGLRPLAGAAGKNGETSRISRQHALRVDPAGLVSISGGKWTTFRSTGAEAIDLAARIAELPASPSRSREVHLVAPETFQTEAFDADCIREVVREEMARSVEDVLARRSRCLFLDARIAIEWAPQVARIVAEELGRDEEWIRGEEGRFRELAERYIPAGEM